MRHASKYGEAKTMANLETETLERLRKASTLQELRAVRGDYLRYFTGRKILNSALPVFERHFSAKEKELVTSLATGYVREVKS